MLSLCHQVAASAHAVQHYFGGVEAEVCRLRDELATKQHRIDFLEVENQTLRQALAKGEHELHQARARIATQSAKIRLMETPER